MAQGSSNLGLNLSKVAGTVVSTSTGNADAGTQRVVIASNQPSITVSTTQPAYGLSNVTITGTSGQFSCIESDTTPLTVGQQITITGILSGSGSITGYTNPKAYLVSQTNGATTFTLVTLTGSSIVTSVGTTTGLTFFMRGQQDVNIIGLAKDNLSSINDKLTNGTQKSIVRSGAKGASVSADVTSTSVSTDVQALDVSVKSALPAGNNAIGKLSSNDGIDIGDVTVNNAFIPVTDNGGSLTVDAPLSTPVYVRISNGTTTVDALPVTDNGGSLTVDGSVNISNFPATQPVSGTVTVAQANAANLNATVTGNVSASQSGTWNIGSITTLPALPTGANTIGAVISSPNSGLTHSLSNANTTAYAASIIAKASAGVLYMITGFNSRASGQFIQLHDSATLPADASVPKLIFYVEAKSNFALDLGKYGRYFTTGIVICNSSTGPTKTIGAADCWFDVQYK